MSWGRIDDNLHEHPKIMKATGEAIKVWVRGLSYCAHYLTDGFIPREMVFGWCGGEEAMERVAKCLVEGCAVRTGGSGLWEVAEGGWQMHDYVHANPPAAQVIEKRQQAADRFQRYYKRKKGRSNAADNALSNAADNALLRDRDLSYNHNDTTSDLRDSTRSNAADNALLDPGPEGVRLRGFRDVLLRCWNNRPPGVDRWTPSNTAPGQFLDLAEKALADLPRFPAYEQDLIGYAVLVVQSVLAVDEAWPAGAPALSPVSYARPKWWPRVQLAMEGRLDRIGPPVVLERKTTTDGRIPVAQNEE